MNRQQAHRSNFYHHPVNACFRVIHHHQCQKIGINKLSYTAVPAVHDNVYMQFSLCKHTTACSSCIHALHCTEQDTHSHTHVHAHIYATRVYSGQVNHSPLLIVKYDHQLLYDFERLLVQSWDSENDTNNVKHFKYIIPFCTSQKMIQTMSNIQIHTFMYFTDTVQANV